ncbi:MAG: NAD(P)-dependent oxidoreductase, partial [Pseudomonadota bacterium]|nr:NAD(P)-dependent oxidoreductase [Pseudomonadota bacterium]
DLEAASDKNICVSNAVAYCTDSVVQHVWALILALTTRIFDYSQAATDGRWERSNSFCVMDYSVKELAGKTLGVVGAGELGRAVASVGLAFGMNVKYALFPERHSFTHDNRLEFKVLLQQSDIVTLHCPLTKDNVNLIDKKELKLMKSTAILINTARGKLVNELSLRDALVKGEIGGAGLDVLSQEPPCEGNTLLDDSLPNLIITPHTAWISLEARQRLVEQVAGTVGKFLKGEKINSVC